jgi:hypothetical protein
MILGDKARETGGSTMVLDDLFRRVGVRRPDGVALVDPTNRESLTGGSPRSLTFAQIDRAVSALAAKLCRTGLRTDTVVAIQLPNTVEAVVTLLAVLRAGMIAVPLPLLWRRHDMVAALQNVGAKVLITSSRIGEVAHAELAMEVAAKLFSIRFVCAFGSDLPDGVLGLDDVFTAHRVEVVPRSARTGNPASHVAAVTFDVTPGGPIAVPRSHSELIAGGVAVFLESGSLENTGIVSAIPPASFAGFSTVLLPWLLGGGTLHLHHGFAPETFAAQCAANDSRLIVLPGPVFGPLAEAGQLGPAEKTVLALWRSPERLQAAASPDTPIKATVVDIASFGEVGLVAARRGADGRIAPLRLGTVTAPQEGDRSVMIAETARSAANTLMLAGPMVPVHAFPRGAADGDEPHLTADENGYVDTGFPCRLDPGGDTLTVTGPPGGITAIGAYRFRSGEIEARVAHADATATVVALPDAILGQRLAGSTTDREAVFALLRQSGANPLIGAAFAPRGAPTRHNAATRMP